MKEKELMLMMGPIGSGKTTFAELSLEDDTSIRISQDEMGRKRHRELFKEAVDEGIPRIIIDRMNFNKQQRSRYIDYAREKGYVVTIFELDPGFDACLKRVIKRKNHPTVPHDKQELAKDILNMYYKEYEKPEPNEYDNYNVVDE